MKPLSSLGSLLLLFVFSCGSEISKEKLPIVNAIDETISLIDSNHRVEILEDDIVSGDSLIKILGYSMDGKLQKIVSDLRYTSLSA